MRCHSGCVRMAATGQTSTSASKRSPTPGGTGSSPGLATPLHTEHERGHLRAGATSEAGAGTDGGAHAFALPRQWPPKATLDTVDTSDYICSMSPRRHTKTVTSRKRAVVREHGPTYTVREAKAKFSEVIRLAGEGTEVTITSHGQPKVLLRKAGVTPRPFRVDRHWLKTMRVADGALNAARIIRQDRDARG